MLHTTAMCCCITGFVHSLECHRHTSSDSNWCCRCCCCVCYYCQSYNMYYTLHHITPQPLPLLSTAPSICVSTAALPLLLLCKLALLASLILCFGSATAAAAFLLVFSGVTAAVASSKLLVVAVAVTASSLRIRSATCTVQQCVHACNAVLV
jgi:hypothetical protein